VSSTTAALGWLHELGGVVLGWDCRPGRRLGARRGGAPCCRPAYRALAGFIPDCLVLLRQLLADPRVPRSRKCLLVGLVGYLALPFDLVPGFIPIAGQLDDVIVVGLVLRAVVRTDGGGLVRKHWPGPQRSLELVLRAAGVRLGARDLSTG
jgi:uncharacterized membrane protein YkvA (DUF1232 family)